MLVWTIVFCPEINEFMNRITTDYKASFTVKETGRRVKRWRTGWDSSLPVIHQADNQNPED